MNDLRQWQSWEAQMLGLLKPALMPIQGSVWSCVRLQQDQSRVMPLWGARRESTHTAPEVCSGPQSGQKDTKMSRLPTFFNPYTEPLRVMDEDRMELRFRVSGVDQMLAVLFPRHVGVVPVELLGREPRETKGLHHDGTDPQRPSHSQRKWIPPVPRLLHSPSGFF